MKTKGFFPVIVTDRLAESKKFYTEHLGFDVAFEADWYLHLANAEGVQLGFLAPGHESQPAFLQKAVEPQGLVYSLEVEDAAGAHAELTSKGLDVALELKDEEWGQRHFMLTDPNGVTVDIVEPIEPSEAFKAMYMA